MIVKNQQIKKNRRKRRKNRPLRKIKGRPKTVTSIAIQFLTKRSQAGRVTCIKILNERSVIGTKSYQKQELKKNDLTN